MAVHPITSIEEFHQLIKACNAIVIDFWASWCGPCQVISPVFERISGEARMKNVKFCKVDVDTQQAITREVGVKTMPTFVAYKGGQKVGEIFGASPPALEKMVQTLVV